MSNRLPKLKEIFKGGLKLLASPKQIASLDRRRENNKDLDRLLRAFDNPRRRQLMFEQAWRWLDSQIEYRLKQKGAPFIAVYGDRGIGKSEAEATLMFRLAEAYKKFLGIDVVLAIGRNPSDINELLARATEQGKVAIVAGDETEKELGVGSMTEEQALLDNLETIRVLLHTIIRCANRYRKFKVFSYYCDFVLEVIFRDDHNRSNYAILYIIDEETGSDPRIPMFIIDLPLHEHKWFRDEYEEMKIKEQVEFTASGGRRSRVKTKLLPAVEALVKLCTEESLTVGRGNDIKKADDLMPKLIFHVTVERFGIRGDKWNTTENRLICQEAFDMLKKKANNIQEGKDTKVVKEHVWSTDFEWREQIASLMQGHALYGRYHLYYIASEVMGLNHYKDNKEFGKITGTRSTTNRKWTKRMDIDESFQGWLKDKRGKMYESYLAQKFKAAGFEVEPEPRFKHKDIRYEEDLLITIGKREVWINAKCGYKRSYRKEEYHTTYILSHILGKEAYIVFFDLDNERCEVHLPDEQFTVGKEGIVESPKIASGRKKSGRPKRATPFLILEALRVGAGGA